MMQESANIPSLLRTLGSQTCRDFDLYCCINHPDDASQEIKEDNLRSITLLEQQHTHLIKAVWHGKQRGVGWARKLLFDDILRHSDDNELIVSLDADTSFSATYLESILTTMNLHPQADALCVPYYHPLNGDEATDRAMLRYELYMRHYMLCLLLIGNPYAFTALGSAMAFPATSYRKVGGITPLQGGEDFYLMQKFAKTGTLLRKGDGPLDTSCLVQPQGRISHRVPFGTGPAIAQGLEAMETSYPFYNWQSYQKIQNTYNLFPILYNHDKETPMSSFLRRQLKTDDIWGPLRRNFKDPDHFVHACQERVDGLRILQFLRAEQKKLHLREQQNNLTNTSPEGTFLQIFSILGLERPDSLNFATSPLSELNQIRNLLYQKEMERR